MCTHQRNTNKGYYLPPDTYLGIFSIPYHPSYIVRRVAPIWNHPLWCYDLHLSGAYVCFPTRVISSVWPIIIFLEQQHIIFVGLFLKICKIFPCYLEYERNIQFYPTLMEADFNGTITFVGTRTCLGTTQIYMDLFCIPSVIKANHKRGWQLVH